MKTGYIRTDSWQTDHYLEYITAIELNVARKYNHAMQKQTGACKICVQYYAIWIRMITKHVNLHAERVT